MSHVRYSETSAVVVEAVSVSNPGKPGWRARLACRLWGHHVDNRSFRQNARSERSCRCGERYLATDGSHTRVRHTLSCFLGHHTYARMADRDAHHEYACLQCGHPLVFAADRDPYAAAGEFTKKVRYLCGLPLRTFVPQGGWAGPGDPSSADMCRGWTFCSLRVVASGVLRVRLPELRPPVLFCRFGDPLKTLALVAAEALFLWMFLAADSLEQLAASGAFGGEREAQAALAFAASWRHGMAGNSLVFMPGFFAVAAAAWIWFEPARKNGVGRHIMALLAACGIAAAAAPAGAVLVVSAFEIATGSATDRPLPFADPRAMFMALYTLLTWTAFVIGCRFALYRRTFAPLVPAVPLTAGLVALRPWTVDDFTTTWWHGVVNGDMAAVLSAAMVPSLAVYLYRRRTAPRLTASIWPAGQP